LDGDSYPPPLSFLVILSESFFNPLSPDIVVVNFVILFLILCSGLMSASEVAFFSLTRPDLENLKDSEDKTDNHVALLMERPRYLLSTILITNNLVNIGVIILSYFVTTRMLNFIDLSVAGFLIPGYAIEFTFNVVVVTIVLVLFGEATPKVCYCQINGRLVPVSIKVVSPFKLDADWFHTSVGEQVEKAQH